MTTKRSSPPRVLILAAIMVLAALGWPLGSAAPRDNRPAAKFLNAPLSFEPNQRQAASPVQFLQINVLIPPNAPTGSAVPLVVMIGGASSRTDATIAIQ
ncbi:MAG: hypothetical protein ABSH56_27660 [Bryobacteraceae bacterium]